MCQVDFHCIFHVGVVRIVAEATVDKKGNEDEATADVVHIWFRWGPGGV
jgi:hypothetical protein